MPVWSADNWDWALLVIKFWIIVLFTYLCTIALGVQTLTQSSFGLGSGMIWLNDVMCTGNERTLINCTSNSTGMDECTHDQDAGVRCSLGILVN